MSEKPTADWGADSHSGSRIVNEDFIAFTRYDDETEIAQKGICLVVTDGSSSARCGQRAAQLAAFKVLESYYSQQTSPDPKTALRFGVQSALSLLEYESAQTKCDGMSVSVAAAAIYDGQMHVAWVGNARAYVLRNGHINTLTTPDIINPSSPFLLGPAQGILESTLPVEGGDRIILCTDGIYQVLNDEAIATLATNPQRPEDAAHALIQGALAQHTHDNASAIVFDNGKALVKHTPKPVAPLRRPGFQLVPIVAATLGIILFVAGSATLLSRRTRSTLPAVPAVATEVQQVEAAPAAVAEALDPSAGQPTDPVPASEPTISEAAALIATEAPLPSETPLPEPTVTPLPLPTEAEAEAVVQATDALTRTGMQIRVQSEPVSSPTAILIRPSPTRLLPTRLPPTASPTRRIPTATRIASTRVPATVGPTPTRRRPRPTVVPTVIAIQPTVAPVQPTAYPTDVPKPHNPPPQPQPTARPTDPPPPPPTARPTDPPPPPPTARPTDPPPPPPTDPPPPPTKAPPPPPSDVQSP